MKGPNKSIETETDIKCQIHFTLSLDSDLVSKMSLASSHPQRQCSYSKMHSLEYASENCFWKSQFSGNLVQLDGGVNVK